ADHSTQAFLNVRYPPRQHDYRRSKDMREAAPVARLVEAPRSPIGQRTLGVGVKDNVVSVSAPQGMVGGVTANGVSESLSQGIGGGVMVNGVSEPIPQDMVNGVRANGVCESGHQERRELEAAFKHSARVSPWQGVTTHALLMMKVTKVKIALPRCAELRRSSCSEESEDMFILYCRRAVVEDLNLAREIDGLCAGLIARIEERGYFIDELDVLTDRFLPKKMAEFMKEIQEKDRNRLMRL
nr:hypothetical protein [Tanacetum cinerariifolium]